LCFVFCSFFCIGPAFSKDTKRVDILKAKKLFGFGISAFYYYGHISFHLHHSPHFGERNWVGYIRTGTLGGTLRGQ
jgi:hypothetical protein